MAKNKKSKKKVQVEVVARTPKPKSSRKAGRKRKRGVARVPHMSRLTEPGRVFLQTALASRDFPGVKGPIPDASVGASVVIRSRTTYTINGTSGGNWTALLLPTPGVACWSANSQASTGVYYNANPFADFKSIFGATKGGSNALANVDAFRYVSKTFEIKPVSATLNNAGLILCARVPNVMLTSSISGAYPQAPVQAIAGLANATPSALSAMPAVYQGHINQGVYGFCIQGQPQWPWTPIQVNADGTNIPYAEDTTKACLNINDTLPDWVGYGTMSPVVITISGTNGDTAWALTVEDVIEYRPAVGSLLAETAAPGHAIRDQAALDLYEMAAERLQPFCPAGENDGFWDKFLHTVSMVAAGVAPISGQYGPLVGAVGGIAQGLRSLIV